MSNIGTATTTQRLAVTSIASCISIAVLFLDACGGDTGVPKPGNVIGSSDDKFAMSMPVPSSAPVTMPLPAAGTVIELPPVSGFGGTITVPKGFPIFGTTLTLQSFAGPTFPTPTPHRPGKILFTETFVVSQRFDVDNFPSITLTLPSSIKAGNQNFYVSTYDVSTRPMGQGPVLGPGSIAGQSVSFSPPPFVTRLESTETVIAQLYKAAPTPAPMPSTTTIPTPPPLAAPALLMKIPAQGQPAGIVEGPDGNVWVATSMGNNNGFAVDKITTTGSVTRYPFSQGETDPIGDLAVGPTGSDLWLAASQNVVRISFDGSVTSYPLSPFLSYDFIAIAPGLGGHMWVGSPNPSAFSSFASNGIAENGSRADFRTMFLGGSLHEVRGPDGAAWGTTQNGLVRYGLNGLQDATPVDTANFVDAITVGPDGYLWFTEDFRTGVVGRLGPGGIVTRYVLPPHGSNTELAGITSGSDGALWFTEWSVTGKSCALGRVTVGGRFTTFTLPMFPCQAGGIVTGADGNLWFVDIYNQQVDVFSP